MNRFPMPIEEKTLPRRGGTFPIEEVSFDFDPAADGGITFYPNRTDGRALTQLRVDYIIERGDCDGEYWISEIRWAAPDEDNWQMIPAMSPLFWAIEDQLLRRTDVSQSFARWRAENTVEKPYQFNVFRTLELQLQDRILLSGG